MRALKWFSDDGPVTPTRHDDVHVWKQDRALWRTLVTDAEGDVSVTGPAYRTKLEALSVIDAVHNEWNGAA